MEFHGMDKPARLASTGSAFSLTTVTAHEFIWVGRGEEMIIKHILLGVSKVTIIDRLDC